MDVVDIIVCIFIIIQSIIIDHFQLFPRH